MDFHFALVQESGSKRVSPCGTVPFIAPEVLESQSYDGLAANIWSLGVVLRAGLEVVVVVVVGGVETLVMWSSNLQFCIHVGIQWTILWVVRSRPSGLK